VSLGLGERFHDVKEKYKEVNDMLGDIVKVTPSSKMVGDLAIFMVQNDLDAGNIVEKGEKLAFPDSVVSYFEGMMGQPQDGFPEDIQKIVLKGAKPITCRPGELLEPIDFDDIANQMKPFCLEPEMRDIVSYCLYPSVLKSYYAQAQEYSDLSNLETPVFFNGMTPGETTTVEIEAGKILIIKLNGIGEINEDGLRPVEFELNGFRREVMVPDMTKGPIPTSFVAADPNNPMELGANIPGMISRLHVSEGDEVKKNDVVAIIEAMKMETAIVSNVDGIIDKVHVKERQAVKVKELIISMRPGI